MNDDTDRLKRDLETIENALGVNLWTRRDVRRGLLGVIAGAAAGLFLAIWCGFGGDPQLGLVVFLAILMAIVIAKGIGFSRQPAPAAGSNREINFYNRFYWAVGILAGGFYIWGQGRGLDPQTLLAGTIILVGSWYLFYAISAVSRWISIGGAIPLIACGFLFASARDFTQSICWLGITTTVGCAAESALLLVALRRPPIAPDAPNVKPQPPASPRPSLPTAVLCDAAH